MSDQAAADLAQRPGSVRPSRPGSDGERPAAKRLLQTGAFLAAAVAVAAFFQFRSPNVPDPDSLYHFHHAALYRMHGPFASAFPWTIASVIRTRAADLWYGFHLLLVPASLTSDPGLGIKLAGTLGTLFLLVSVRAALVRLEMRAASFWPFLLLFSGPNLLYHFTMTRPHVLTTGLTACLFGLCVAPGGAAAAFVVAAALTSIHLSLGWMAVVVIGAVLLVKALAGAPLEAPKAAAAVAGLLLGALLRPHPLGALQLAWVQIFGLTLARQRGEVLLLGKELLPITGDVVARNLVPMMAVWAGAMVLAFVAWRRGARARGDAPEAPRGAVLMASSLLLSGVFFLMMFGVARRSFAPWALFAVVFTAGAVTLAVGPRDARGGSARWVESRAARLALIAGAGLFSWMATVATVRQGRDLAAATPPGECREVAQWIAAHGRPGDVVYNVSWDAFPKLFLWNDTSRYINGMDPIFEYAFDRGLAYESFHIQVGGARERDASGGGRAELEAPAVTCAWARCTPQNSEDTYTVLRRDFQASWLFVEKARSPALYAWVKSDPRFRPGFENETQAVFGLE